MLNMVLSDFHFGNYKISINKSANVWKIAKLFLRVRQCTRLAQLEERSAFNRVVVGSIPTSGAFLLP